MGMFDLLLGRKSAPAAKPRSSNSNSNTGNSTQFGASQMAGSAHAMRKDMVRLALRETLTRSGIPSAWISADMLRTSSSQREAGLHVRLQVRHWEPRLMQYGVALEQEFAQRLAMLDPQANTWLSGFSWQFALEDTSPCPGLPHPGSWTATATAPTVQPAAAPVVAPAAAPAQAALPTASGGVIEGPTTIPRPTDDVRGDLERLLALRDEDMRRHAEGGDSFAPTRPATL